MSNNLCILFSMAMVVVLSSCGGSSSGGGGSRNPTPTPSPTLDSTPGSPTPTPSSTPTPGETGDEVESTLSVTITNLQSDLIVTWHGQDILFNPETSRGEFTIRNTEPTDVNYQTATFQPCPAHELNQTASGVEQHFTLTIDCADPQFHSLRTAAQQLRGELEITWGDQVFTLSEGEPTVNITSAFPEVAQPMITAQPNLQTCTITSANLLDGLQGFADIECEDHTAQQVVNLTSELPFPVSLAAGIEVYDITASVTLPVSSRIDGLVFEDIQGSQTCSLEEQNFDEQTNQQFWALTCREVIVYIDRDNAIPGVYIRLDDGEEHLLEAGDFTDEAVFLKRMGPKVTAFSSQFGIKQLTRSDDQFTWQDIEDLPEGVLQQFIPTESKFYTKFVVDNQTNFYVVDQTLAVELLNTRGEIGNAVRTNLLPTSYHEDTITVEFIHNDDSRTLMSYDGVHPQNLQTYETDNNNPVQVVIEQDFPFVLVADNSVEGESQANPEQHLTDMVLGVSNQQVLIDHQMDTNLSAVNWTLPSGQNILLAVGDNVTDENPRSNQFAKFSLDIVDRQLQTEWQETEVGRDRTFGYLGTDGKILLVTSDSGTLEHGLAELYRRATGRVNLISLADESGMQLPVRVQSNSQPVFFDGRQVGNQTKAISTNGLALLYSGTDENGSIWITNGTTEATWKIRDNTNWQTFAQTELYFAGKHLGVANFNGQVETLMSPN